MPEREDTVEFNIQLKASLFGKLERLRGMLGEPADKFYSDALEKGGAVKELDQVYDQVVAAIDDEDERIITLFEFMDRENSGAPLPFEPKLLPFEPRRDE